jgi:tripartite-type tricarboxylate transporter receptor subunit TctC
MIYRSLLLSALVLAIQPCLAAENYPARPILLITPYAAGSDTDNYARMMGKLAEKALGQPLIYESKVGGSGAAASLQARSAVADGYTLLVARVGSHAITPAMSVEPPYLWSDFTTLAIMGSNPMICAVSTHAPWKTVRELIADIRKSPGKRVYSTASVSSVQNLAVQYLLTLSGLKPESAKALHFDSASQATESVLDGRADFVCNNANTLLPRIKAGQLRGLFTTAQGRMSALPELPNAREVGLRDMASIQGWTALVGPAGLPEGVKKKWRVIFEKLAKDPEWLKGNADFGGQSTLLTIKNPEQFVREQYTLYEQLISSLGIRP